jgi:hypothetical protein
MMQGRKAQEFK